MIAKLSTIAAAVVLAHAMTIAPAKAQDLADYDYENLTFRGIGFDYGYIWPTKVRSTSSYQVRLDLGYLGPGIRIAPVISYWSSRIRPSEISRFADQLNRLQPLRDRGVTIDPSELGVISWSDLSIGLDAHVVWTTPIQVLTYIGMGIGMHALNGQGEAVEDTFVEDLLDSTGGSVALMAGVEMQPIQRLRFYSEARMTVASDLRYPGVRIGAALMLPPRATTPAQED